MADTTPRTTNSNLKPPDFLTYNVVGLRPVQSVFNMDCEMFANFIRDIASKEIDGIKDVTCEFNSSTGAVGWFIWFDSNSDHFVDRATETTALGKKISRYSQKFQSFAQKFGWRESDDDPDHGDSTVRLKQIVQQNKNREIRQPLTYLQIAITPFLAIMFDSKGTAYQKEFGIPTPKVSIICKYQWKKGSGEEFHTLIGLRVEKNLSGAFKEYKKPRANRNGSFN